MISKVVHPPYAGVDEGLWTAFDKAIQKYFTPPLRAPDRGDLMGNVTEQGSAHSGNTGVWVPGACMRPRPVRARDVI